MKTVSFPCPHTTSLCPLEFCKGEARDDGSGKFFCGKCGSSYISHESAQELRIEAYRNASQACTEHIQEYITEATKLEHRLKAKTSTK